MMTHPWLNQENRCESRTTPVRVHRRLRMGNHQGEPFPQKYRSSPAALNFRFRLQLRLCAFHFIRTLAGPASQLVLLRL